MLEGSTAAAPEVGGITGGLTGRFGLAACPAGRTTVALQVEIDLVLAEGSEVDGLQFAASHAGELGRVLVRGREYDAGACVAEDGVLGRRSQLVEVLVIEDEGAAQRPGLAERLTEISSEVGVVLELVQGDHDGRAPSCGNGCLRQQRVPDSRHQQRTDPVGRLGPEQPLVKRHDQDLVLGEDLRDVKARVGLAEDVADLLAHEYRAELIHQRSDRAIPLSVGNRVEPSPE